MDDWHSGRLKIWAGGTSERVREPLVPDIGHVLAGPHKLMQFADVLYASEAMNLGNVKPQNGEGAEPYTLQWFLNAEQQRYRKHGRWLNRLLEFAKHSGEIMLGIGNGLGTDWVQYARHGAEIVVCTSSSDQLSLIRWNFELRGLVGRFLHAAPAALPLPAAAVDVVCLIDFTDEVGDLTSVIEEIYRVLKPGGKVLAVMPARYDIDFWARHSLPWQRWFRRTAGSTISGKLRFTRRGLRQLFRQFTESRIYKRQLRRSEVPPLWRWIPLSLMERLMGHVLVYKAFKPLSAAMTVREAA
jgi:ubiquinone/menaquinone biosynthesis C-methylase UbiE